MQHPDMTCAPVAGALEMNLVLAAHACERHLPSLAARRLRQYQSDIGSLEQRLDGNESAQRLARKLFGLMANASVHGGGADTLPPLFAQLSLLRVYLWLSQTLSVHVPEPLVRGTPDLVVHVGGESLWVDCQPRPPHVLDEQPRQRYLLAERTLTRRRHPPLRLGDAYAAELHLHDNTVLHGMPCWELEVQSGDARGDAALAALIERSGGCRQAGQSSFHGA